MSYKPQIENKSEAILEKMNQASKHHVFEMKTELIELLDDDYPGFLLSKIPDISSSHVRLALITSLVPFARTSTLSLECALAALKDKSKFVRSAATAVLAYSLDRTMIEKLNEVLEFEKIDEVRADVYAAISAIQHQNHHLYVDRRNTGKIFWNEVDRKSEM